MAITFGPLMVFPDSYDRDEPDYSFDADEDFDPRDEAYPFLDYDGVMVIDSRDEADKGYADYLAERAEAEANFPADLDEDWVLNLRGAW